MSVQPIVCDGCGNNIQNVYVMVEFEARPLVRVHLCNECIEKAHNAIKCELFKDGGE